MLPILNRFPGIFCWRNVALSLALGALTACHSERHADEQGVAATEDRHEQLIEHDVLADDDLAQLGTHLPVGMPQVIEHL